MPAPEYSITAGNIVEHTFFGRYQGQVILHVLHHRYDGPTTFDWGDEFANLYAKLVSDVGSFFQFVLLCESDEVEYTKVRQQIIYPNRRPYHDVSTLTQGSRALTNPMPSNVAAVINKQTSILARGRTGSLHLPGMDVSDQEDGIWDADYQTLLFDVAAQLPNNIPAVGAGANWIPVTWSRSQPAADATIIDAFPMETVRVMRRRTIGKGV